MILETERLILRPLTLADAETAYYAWTGDAEANKWVSWLPHYSLDDTIEWLKKIDWEQSFPADKPRDSYIWGFVLKETGKLFGSGGLIWEEDYQLYQIGYNINKSYWNKGYTTEAMRTILDYAAKTLGLKCIAGGHAKENPASAKVLEKLGFVYDRDDIVPHVDDIRSFDSREYYLDLDECKKDRTLCLRVNSASLYFAKEDDMWLVYDMMHEDKEIRDILFCGESEDWSWEKYQETERKWFPGTESKNSYYLIEYENEIIGWISHAYNDARIENMEVDIAFSSLKHAGKGLGTKIIVALTDYANKEYGIKTFMIRPGIHNKRAIRAYEKSGFKVNPSFNTNDYYTAEDAVLWGDGDCGADGTYNMVKIYD